MLPCSYSKVPFVWEDRGVGWGYEFLGGLLAVEQDPALLAVRPKVGWAVRSVAQAGRMIRSDSDDWDDEDEDGWDEQD
jgi:hypothetical protein